MLGLHEGIQERVREELDRILQSDDDEGLKYFETNDCVLAKHLKVTNITTEQLKEMKYLDRVIKESLRMWPSIPFVARQMTEDLLVGEYDEMIILEQLEL